MITAQSAPEPARDDGRHPRPVDRRPSLANTLMRIASGGPVAGRTGFTFGSTTPATPETIVATTHTTSAHEDASHRDDHVDRRAA